MLAFKLFKNIKIGKLVRLFVLADLALIAGWGLISPVFALFVVDRIAGASVITVGVSAAIYWIIKAIAQLPIATFLDKTSGEKDDFIFLIMGLVLASFSAFAFVFVDRIWQLYLLQGIHAVAFAMYVPSWSGIFSRHLDKHHEALDWSLDNSGMSLSAGVTGLASGFLVTYFGYNAIFILGALFSFISAIIIFSAPEVVFPHRIHKRRVLIRDHRPIVTGR